MKTSRPKVLAISSLNTHFTREIFHGMVGYAREHTRWNLVWHTTIPADESKVAGILTFDDSVHIATHDRYGKPPVVILGTRSVDPTISSVCVNDHQVGTIAAQYFADLGLRNFAFVGHGTRHYIMDRLEGYARTIEEMGLGQVNQWFGEPYDLRGRPQFERGLAHFLRGLSRPCGILTANDSIGMEVVNACVNAGIRIPDDIAVLGVDDDDLACELSQVPLSSIVQPLYAIGYQGAQLLDQKIQKPNRPSSQIFLSPLRVAPRASSDLIVIDDRDVAGALRLIKEHCIEPISVAWIVDQLAVARRSLERKFKTMIGRTILEHIHRARCEKAKQLLIESDLGVQAIAKRAGFANARWMADSFRRELNITPTRFRQQYRERRR